MAVEKEVIFLYPNPYGPGERLVDVINNMPVAFLCMSAFLEDHGILTRIIDTRAEDYRQQDYSNAIFVGITALTGMMIKNGLTLARFVRERHPDVPIVWGGSHPSLMPAQTIQHPLVDIVCQGEGEHAALDLAQALLDHKDIRDIAGLVTREMDNPARPWMNMDEIPPLPYEKLVLERYKNRTFFEFPTSRGCPHKCVFCYNLVYNWDHRTGQPSYRMQSADYVVEQLERVLRQYPMQMAGFVEDNFFTSKKRVTEIAEGIVRKGLKFQWFTNGVASYFRQYDDDFLDLLRASGCYRIDIGAESGSPLILNVVGKGTVPEDILISARKCNKHGITPSYSFIIGWPEETEEDLEMTLALIDRLVDECPLLWINGVYVITPFPGTPYYQQAVDAGFIPSQDLEGWGDHLFAADAENHTPWNDRKKRNRLVTIARISKTDFHPRAFSTPYRGRLKNAVHRLMSLDARLRWKYRLFSAPYEWLAYDYVQKLHHKF